MQDIPYILSHPGKNRPLRNLQAPEEGPPGLTLPHRQTAGQCLIRYGVDRLIGGIDYHAGLPPAGFFTNFTGV